MRIAPRKVRLIADLIRGKSIREAETILRFTTKKGTIVFSKLLKAAVAGAKLRFEVQENQLYIEKLFVDEGSKLKRWRARARGQAFEIQKKTSHITLVLGSRGELKEKKQTSEALIQEVRDEQEKMKDESKKQAPRATIRREFSKTEQRRRIFRRKSI